MQAFCRTGYNPMQKRIDLLFIVLSAVLCGLPVHADGQRDNDPANVRPIPRQGIEVPPEREKILRGQLGNLQEKIRQLSVNPPQDIAALLPDVLVFERAVRITLDHNEFFSPKDLDKADALLNEGLRRATELSSGESSWSQQPGLVIRGYVSRIDHTVQPYGLVVPSTYAFNHSVPTRCDVWFHGRGETLSELNFIYDRMKSPGRYMPEHTIVLHPYGRYSNAFKFAGETDVFEALEDVKGRYRIDEDRISVRGFSMGGAACWQFAVHYPDRWFAANPGAGFSETPEFLRFFQKEKLRPAPWEAALWNLYDCNRYAGNLKHCPVIAYSGEKDIQKQAADLMEEAMFEYDLRLRHVIGAHMGHNIDEESMRLIEERMRNLSASGRRRNLTDLHLQTHTLKYNRMHWLTVTGLGEHWKPAQVNIQLDPKRPEKSLARGTESPTVGPVVWMNCSNVTALTINPPMAQFGLLASTSVEVRIHDDGEEQFVRTDGPMSDGTCPIHLERNSNGQWSVVSGPKSGLHKRHNLQGPIDDAFMDSFVFVRPTGVSKNSLVGQWAEGELDRAVAHWRRHFRGDARVVADTAVTDELIETANLVLWGDPDSNMVLRRIQTDLPIRWDADWIDAGVGSFDSDRHALIAIYPNPLNPNRYVVLNSSFTFRDYAYLNNARQVPMLPDWAVVDLTEAPGNVWPGRIVAADFFDERWQLKIGSSETGGKGRD